MRPISLDFRRLFETYTNTHTNRYEREPKFYDHGKVFCLYDSYVLNIKGLYRLHRGLR